MLTIKKRQSFEVAVISVAVVDNFDRRAHMLHGCGDFVDRVAAAAQVSRHLDGDFEFETESPVIGTRDSNA